MENETKTKTSLESLNNKKLNKNINSHMEEEEIKNNSDGNEINFDKTPKNNQLNIEKNTNIELNEEHSEYKNINKEETTKKFINNRVNNILNDIYGSLSNINEVNEKVKNILSKRKTMNSFRTSSKIESNFKIKNKRSSTTTKIKDLKNKSIIKEEKIDDNYLAKNETNNIYNIEDEATKNETTSINFKSKLNNSYYYNRINDFSNNKTKNINSVKEHDFTKVNLPSKINKSNKKNYLKENKYLKYDELANTENSAGLNEKNIEYSNINYNSYYHDDENESMIKAMKLKLKNEEKKLKELEEEKNKLLNEEKIRRKIIIEKIKKKNIIKKQYLIKEYKKKMRLLRELQTNNINEIKKLERKKKIDEDKIVRIDKICQNMNINNHSLLKCSIKNKSNIKNSLSKKNTEDYSENSNYLMSDNEVQNKSIKKKKSTNYYTFYNNHLAKTNEVKNKSYYTENEEGITEDYKFNQSINELSSTCDNNDDNQNETFSYSQYSKSNNCKRKLNFDESFKTEQENLNPYNYLYNYYQNLNKNNNIYNFENEKLNLDNYFIQKEQKKRYYSDNRKYEKRLNNSNSKRKFYGTRTPNQEVLSFIQGRVNRYNHSLSKDSTISKRLSQIAVIPSSLNYNFNNNYNYKYVPSSLSSTNYKDNFCKKNNRKIERKKNKNLKDLNFKYIFFNNK